MMDPQQLFHLIHPVLRRRNDILWDTFKNKLPICWSLSAFPNFEISKAVCNIVALISTLKAFSHLKLVNNCKVSDKITTCFFWHSLKTKPSNLVICVNGWWMEPLGQICAWWRFQSCFTWFTPTEVLFSMPQMGSKLFWTCLEWVSEPQSRATCFIGPNRWNWMTVVFVCSWQSPKKILLEQDWEDFSLRNSIPVFWDLHSQHVIIIELGSCLFLFLLFSRAFNFFFSLCHLPPLWGLSPYRENALISYPKMWSCAIFQHIFSYIFISFQLGSDSS